MSRVHLGMKRPIRQFEEHYQNLLDLINKIEEQPPQDEEDRLLYIHQTKRIFNDCLIQLNNIKNTQIDYLESKGDE